MWKQKVRCDICDWGVHESDIQWDKKRDWKLRRFEGGPRPTGGTLSFKVCDQCFRNPPEVESLKASYKGWRTAGGNRFRLEFPLAWVHHRRFSRPPHRSPSPIEYLRHEEFYHLWNEILRDRGIFWANDLQLIEAMIFLDKNFSDGTWDWRLRGPIRHVAETWLWFDDENRQEVSGSFADLRKSLGEMTDDRRHRFGGVPVRPAELPFWVRLDSVRMAEP
jgi:hypothetical protein